MLLILLLNPKPKNRNNQETGEKIDTEPQQDTRGQGRSIQTTAAATAPPPEGIRLPFTTLAVLGPGPRALRHPIRHRLCPWDHPRTLRRYPPPTTGRSPNLLCLLLVLLGFRPIPCLPSQWKD